MPTVSGKGEIRQFMAGLPEQIERKLLRGAGRAAAKVVAEEAKDRCISSEVQASIKVRVRSTDTRVTASVQTRGPGAYIAPWIEYGTDPHFISVKDSERRGLSVGRFNKKVAEGSLVINGKFVGTGVHHPGVAPNPFMRTSLDVKGGEAVTAAQRYINSRVSRAGITGSDDPAEIDE